MTVNNILYLNEILCYEIGLFTVYFFLTVSTTLQKLMWLLPLVVMREESYWENMME